MQGPSKRDLVIGFAAIVIVVGSTGLYLWHSRASVPNTIATDATSAPPDITQQEKAYIASSSPAAMALISYTDSGFGPATTTVNAGDTVRFFNSSSRDLWVASTNAAGELYPSAGTTCGESAFDMCEILSPKHFWQFTFTKKGTWSYKNNAYTQDTGVVIVQ